MSRIANLAWLNLLQVFKDRMGLLTLILLPLMLTALFGTVMGGGERRIAVAVADLDASVVSSEVVAALDESSYAVTRTDERRATAMASSGEAAAALIIPKGFASDHPGADLLTLKDVTYGRRLSDDEALSPELPDLLTETFKASLGVLGLLARLSPRDAKAAWLR